MKLWVFIPVCLNHRFSFLALPLTRPQTPTRPAPSPLQLPKETLVTNNQHMKESASVTSTSRNRYGTLIDKTQGGVLEHMVLEVIWPDKCFRQNPSLKYENPGKQVVAVGFEEREKPGKQVVAVGFEEREKTW